MDPQEPPGTTRSSQPAWPEPHPSPPLPPPREYGAPGTPPQRGPWLLLAAVLAVALVSVSVVAVRTLDDDDGAGDDAVRQPDPTPAASTTSSEPAAAPAPYRCWDGSDAQQLTDCPAPTGVEALRWLFPQLGGQKCGAPTRSGPGVVLRLLCSARLADGSRVQLGYYQWTSVRAGETFYDDQQLESADSGGFHYWAGRSEGTLKSALLYLDAPFSLTWTVPAGAKAVPADLELVKPRPPEQVRGTPAG